MPELMLGVVLVGVFGLAAVAWQHSSTARSPVAVLSRTVAKGVPVTEADVRPASVALGEGVRAVAWAERSRLVGKRAATDLPAGTMLSAALVGDAPPLSPGEALAGLKLAPGSYPAGELRVGDHVAVVRAAPPATTGAAAEPGAVLAADATVWSVVAVAEPAGGALVTVRLPEAEAATVSAVADQIRLVRVVR